jgi:transcriptional regulator with XRE-family HTH domain
MKHATHTPPTQKQLIQVGMSQSFASQLLAGKKMPSMTMAHRIEKATGFPVHAWLMISKKETAA